jgi:DNA-binding LacI/PurR family transcriptional regulator
VPRPTIEDVARRAGVSIGAVSFALNGRPGVGEETRARILAAAAELGWRPSARARSLVSRKAFALGLVVARAPELIGADPFFPAFIAGVEAVLAARDQVLVLQVVTSEDAEVAGYRRLHADGRVDGVFLSDLRRGEPRVPLLAELGLPAVTLNRPDVPSPFPAVCCDERTGVTAAVTHLAGLGHTRIGHVSGPPAYLHAAARQQAWADALAAAGLQPGPVEAADFTAAGGARATRALLAADHPPTAIVYANDLMALAGMSVAADLGLDVPGDLSVTGFDDIQVAAHLRPPLTTVRVDPSGWGRQAAETLLSLVETGDAADMELDPAVLVIRGSATPPRHP